jgi:hypothetical protein
MRWLVPAMAAAAAVALWVAVVPHDRVLAPSAPVETANARDAVSKVAPSEERKQPSREAPGKAAAASPPPAAKNELSRPTAKLVPPPAGADKRPVARPDAAAPADAKPSAPPESLLSRARAAQAPSPAAAADSAFRQNRLETVTVPVEIASPDPASRWRVRPDGAIEHSSDSGATWTPQGTSPPSTVTSGAAPSRTVAWFVGRGGLVLLTADGVTWQRRDVGEPVDLVSVRPVDDKTATVVAADGRQFTTHDAGVTWTPARLQEIPAASF